MNKVIATASVMALAVDGPIPIAPPAGHVDLHTETMLAVLEASAVGGVLSEFPTKCKLNPNRELRHVAASGFDVATLLASSSRKDCGDCAFP